VKCTQKLGKNTKLGVFSNFAQDYPLAILCMKHLFFCISIFSAATFFLSCQSNTATTTTKNNVKAGYPWQGNWVNQSYLDKLKKRPSPLQVSPAVCFELIFDTENPDSVIVLTAHNQWVSGYVQSSNNPTEKRISIPNNQAEWVLTYLPDKKQLQIAFDPKTSPEVFVEANPAFLEKNKKGFHAFRQTLNAQIWQGSYITMNEFKKPVQITFQKDGKMDGIAEYDNFQLCFTNDCLQNLPMDVVAFKKDTIVDYYGWHKQGDSLRLHYLWQTGTNNNKPVFTDNGVFLEMVRKK